MTNTPADTTSTNDTTDESIISGLTFDQRQRLTDLLDGYLVNLEMGVPTNVDRMLADNADIADALSSYLGQLDALHHVAAGFAPPEEEPDEGDSGQVPTQYTDEQRLGDFILGREIGRGGMGVVYEAHQISLDRKVALKLLPFAAVLDQSQIARFKNEAQAAAQLCHPNIVPVYAVGAERGVNYYAMRLIEGQPLDQAINQLRGDAGDVGPSACPSTAVWNEADPSRESLTSQSSAAGDENESHGLSGGKRIAQSSVLSTKKSASSYYRTIAELGYQAADALHTAHEYGVVHRDIKPSNLLLDPNGKLWITDFGLARCQSNVSLTKSGDLLGTMRYMSPEQALGQSAFVDHRTDVYSLGITLYELMTLRHAFDGENSPAMLRQIETEEPARPRSVCPDVPKDLESVVLKAISKVRDDRYETAAEFAADLQRFLNGESTVAKPPTLVDRATKWVRRHRKAVAVVATIAATLLVATNVVLWFRAQDQQQVIQKKVETGNFGIRMARKFATIGSSEAQFVAHNVIPELLEFYEAIANQDGGTVQQRAEIADAHLQMGILHSQLHATEKAVDEFRIASRQFRELIREQPRESSHIRQLAVCRVHIAEVFREDLHDVESARAMFLKAVSALEALVGRDPSDWDSKSELASARNGLGLLLAQSGEIGSAKVCFRNAVELLLEVVKETGDDDRRLATFYKNLGSVVSDGRESLAWNEQAIKAYRALIQADPNDVAHRHLLALALNERGKIQSRLGQLRVAEEMHNDAINRIRPLHEADPANRVLLADLALCYHDRALVKGKTKQIDAARRDFGAAIEEQSKLVVRYPTIVSYASSLGGMYNNLGMVLEGSGRLSDAVGAFEKAVRFQQVAVNAQPNWQVSQDFLDNHLFNYGRVCRRLGQLSDAAAAALKRKELFSSDPHRLVSVAEELAMLVEQTQDIGDEESNVDTYADAAVATLQQARALGWSPDGELPSVFGVLKSHRKFNEIVNN